MTAPWCPMSGRKVRLVSSRTRCAHCGRRVTAPLGVIRKHRMPVRSDA